MEGSLEQYTGREQKKNGADNGAPEHNPVIARLFLLSSTGLICVVLLVLWVAALDAAATLAPNGELLKWLTAFLGSEDLAVAILIGSTLFVPYVGARVAKQILSQRLRTIVRALRQVCTWPGRSTPLRPESIDRFGRRRLIAVLVATFCAFQAVGLVGRLLLDPDPTTGRVFDFVGFLLSPIFIALSCTTVALLTLLTIKRRVATGYCSRCCYDLTGNTTGICPECGDTISEDIGSESSKVKYEGV